jgi:hypothetical protein
VDKLDKYRQIILDVFDEYMKLPLIHEQAFETYKVIDREGDHYQLMRDGWWNSRRYYGCVMHFDIKDGKIWIRHDGTEDGMAGEFVRRGVAKEDIVFAFHSPTLRHLVEF